MGDQKIFGGNEILQTNFKAYQEALSLDPNLSESIKTLSDLKFRVKTNQNLKQYERELE